MSSAPTLNEYAVAQAIVKDREFWSEISLLTGAIVSLAVLLAGIIVNDSAIMVGSCGVMVAFAAVSIGILLSMRKHNRVLNRSAIYSN